MRRRRRNTLFGQPVAGLDTEAFRIVVSSVPWRVDERRVSGVAVTRHAVFAVASILVGTVDVDGKLDGPDVTVGFRRQIVLDDATPAFRKFPLDRLPPADDRHHVGVIVRLKQGETLAVVEFSVEIDGLDAEVKAVDHTEKLREDAAGSVAVFETALCQRESLVRHTRVQCGVGVECSGSTFRFRMIEAVRLVLVTVVGPQVEVCADLHLLGKHVENVLLKQRIANSFDRLQVELLAEVVENRVGVWCVVTLLAECRDRGPVGARADEDLVNVLRGRSGVGSKIKLNFLVASQSPLEFASGIFS